jgi:hypothetical protein
LRKPSDVTWEVPPLELPTAPKKRSLSGSGTTLDDPDFAPLEEKSEDSGDDDEPAIFGSSFNNGGDDDDDDGDGLTAFQLAGFDDDDNDDDKFVSATKGYPMLDQDMIKTPISASLPTSRMRCASESQSMGASPILLSVLEQVAASQAFGAPTGGRCRADSC